MANSWVFIVRCARILYQFQIKTAFLFGEPLAAVKPPCSLRNLRFRAAAHAPALFEFQFENAGIRITRNLQFLGELATKKPWLAQPQEVSRPG